MVSALPVGAGAKQRAVFFEWVTLQATPLPQMPMLMADGQHRTLADFKGKVVLLNLWSTSSRSWRQELVTLNALEKSMAGKDLVIIPMSVDTGSYSSQRAFLDGMKLALPYLAQDDSHIFATTLVKEGVPTSYLIGRNGLLRYKYAGTADWTDSIQQAPIDELLAEKP